MIRAKEKHEKLEDKLKRETSKQIFERQTKEKEVMSSISSPKHLFKFSKNKLIKLLLETQEKLNE